MARSLNHRPHTIQAPPVTAGPAPVIASAAGIVIASEARQSMSPDSLDCHVASGSSQ